MIKLPVVFRFSVRIDFLRPCIDTKFFLVLDRESGTKKVQQELSKAGVMEKFLGVEDCERIRTHFAKQWAFDGDKDSVGVAVAKVGLLALPKAWEHACKWFKSSEPMHA